MPTFIVVDWDSGQVFQTDTITKQISEGVERSDLTLLDISEPSSPQEISDTEFGGISSLVEWEDD